MSVTDAWTAVGVVFTALAAIIATGAFIWQWHQSRSDQLQQRAAQTKEDLRAIIGDCNRFLRPLSQSYPYPILHTAAAITKEFSSRMKSSPRREDVLVILSNKDLLLSICVEGWISSAQAGRLLDIAEELERKALSRHLRGHLLLICQASFLLAGLVAMICSPESFYEMLKRDSCREQLKLLVLPGSTEDSVENILNTITITLQQSICNMFQSEYKDILKRNLYFIQTVAEAFIRLSDKRLMELAKKGEAPLSNLTDPEIKTNPIIKIEQKALLLTRLKYVRTGLDNLKKDFPEDYEDLCELIDPLEQACVIVLERFSFKPVGNEVLKS
jgi:hypothetical protein